MNIISIDPSKKRTGIITRIDKKIMSMSIEHTKKQTQSEALVNIFNKFQTVLNDTKFDMGLIEGYWLVNPRGMTHEPEIVGVIKLVFALHEVPLIVIPIQTWKSIIGIKIDKKKKPGEYFAAIKKKYGKEFSVVDEADAFLIYKVAEYIVHNTQVMSKAAMKVRNKIKEVIENLHKS